MRDDNNEQKSTSKSEINSDVGGLTDHDLMAVTGGVTINFSSLQLEYIQQTGDSNLPVAVKKS